MAPLHELILEHQRELVERWARDVRAAFDLDSADREEIALDLASPLLRDLADALRRAGHREGATDDSAATAEATTARARRRFHRGWAASRVAEEGELLRRAILAVAGQHGVETTATEHRVLASYTGAWIIRAVSAYEDERRSELMRAGGDPGASIAHRLRNPLNAAMMALSLLRAPTSPTEHARLLDMFERSLKRLSRQIDESFPDASAAARRP